MEGSEHARAVSSSACRPGPQVGSVLASDCYHIQWTSPGGSGTPCHAGGEGKSMTAVFTSTHQERLFQRVIASLESLGYRGELLPQPYSFVDWFLPETPTQEIPAAAFGRTPQSYDSSCFDVLLSNVKMCSDLVHD